MKVLIACEYSGRVRDAFRKRGHDAISCDLLPTDAPGPHYQGDVMDVINDGWDLMIAHPPCTRLCNSGVRWLHERDLWDQMREAADFFKLLLNANIPKIAIENPVMHKYAVEIIGKKHSFSVQPYEHGEPYTKRTCFWTKNLSPLKPTKIMNKRIAQVHKESPGPERWKKRSTTYQGIANAIADQWGADTQGTPGSPYGRAETLDLL